MKPQSEKTDGPNGGRVQSVGEFYIETKAVFPYLYTYLLNDKYKPISNKGITCNVEVLFPDNNQISLELKPEGEDGFRSETNLIGYSWYRVTFQVLGKPISTKFENESIQVKGN